MQLFHLEFVFLLYMKSINLSNIYTFLRPLNVEFLQLICTVSLANNTLL